MTPKAPAKRPGPRRQPRIEKTRLAEMIEEATVDAHDESEQATGWFTMLAQHLVLPFETEVLGITVSVAKIDLGNDDRISVICTRGRYRQAISVVDLPLPSPLPEGGEWIEAYRHWRGGR